MLVVDASVAVKWLIEEENSADAITLLDGRELHAPRLLVSEVANTLWRIARVNKMQSDQAIDSLSILSQMPIHWYEDELIATDAIRLAVGVDRPVYDLMYIALAQRIGTRVVTADSRLINSLATTDLSGIAVSLQNLIGES